MTKIGYGFILAFLVLACSEAPKGFVVNGTINGALEDGTKVYLKTTDSLARKLIDIDTASVLNGQFSFKGTMDMPQVHYIVFEGLRGNAPLVLENGEITFKAHKDSLGFSKVKGTPQNTLFMSYLEEIRTLNSMSKSMNEEFRKANSSKDTAVVQALREEYLELQERARSFDLQFIKENPNALISALLLEQVLRNKAAPVSEVDSLFSSLNEDIKVSRPGKRLSGQLEKVRATAIGNKAPEFSGPTPEGDLLALNEVKGKLTLVDFWAAWCKPCRRENPNIVSVYQKYKDKGLNIVGVSLDRTKEAWLDAIEADGLEWNHISNLQYFQGPIAQLYNINSIPAAFLLDENGVIVAKDLRGQALEQKVAELLN